MNPGWRIGAWLVVLGALVALGTGALMPVGSVAGRPGLARAAVVRGSADRPEPPDSVARVAIARNVFRAARRPAPVAYDAQALVAAANAPPVPKPALALVGIVAGTDPTAVIEGLPGIEGPRVVRAGEIVAGLRITRIGRSDVRIAGLDTVWVLRVREPWRTP